MSHALRIEDVNAIEPDPHLAFAHKVDAVLTSGESLAIIAIEIKGAAALYVGECQAREMRAYEAARTKAADSGAMPRFVERDNPLLPPPPLAVVAPSEPTTEWPPMQPGSKPDEPPTAKLEAVQPQPTEPLPKAEDAK